MTLASDPNTLRAGPSDHGVPVGITPNSITVERQVSKGTEFIQFKGTHTDDLPPLIAFDLPPLPPYKADELSGVGEYDRRIRSDCVWDIQNVLEQCKKRWNHVDLMHKHVNKERDGERTALLAEIASLRAAVAAKPKDPAVKDASTMTTTTESPDDLRARIYKLQDDCAEAARAKQLASKERRDMLELLKSVSAENRAAQAEIKRLQLRESWSRTLDV